MKNKISEIPELQYAYIAFDLFPSSKGAATHIHHCLQALKGSFEYGALICIGDTHMPAVQFLSEEKLYIFRFKQQIVNFLERTNVFQNFVTQTLNLDCFHALQCIHFRDIWGALPSLSFKKKQVDVKLLYEVNAAAHIELPYRYPNISKSVLDTLHLQFGTALNHSDLIITPSIQISNFLQEQYAISTSKIVHIPNGMELHTPNNDFQADTPYVLYFGALQKWQGIKTLFIGFKECLDLDLRLRICASVPEKRCLVYIQMAEEMGIAHRIDWEFCLDKSNLASRIEQSLCTLAPLTDCTRNVIQGCNPLKVIESMGYGTPVIASDLPVLREIMQDGEHGLLVAADQPIYFGRTIRKMVTQPDKLIKIGKKCREFVTNNYLWDQQESKMKACYHKLQKTTTHA
ncbi:MAG: glycosyltransferase family 4 protein [Flavobacteriaceae bacterium]|nr:glycosyltransferase family 4 protein [Flavobacteriaceae bacterium]